MKTSSALFLPFIFLGLFSGYFSSNPDSITEDSLEDYDETNGKIRMEEVKEKTILTVDLPPPEKRKPDSVLIQSLLNNTNKIGQMQLKDNEQKPLTNLDQPCAQTREPDDIAILNPVASGRRMGRIQTEDGQQKVFISVDRPRALVVKYMVPINGGSENLWREVYSKRVDRTRDFNERVGKMQMEEDGQNETTSFDYFPAYTDDPDSIMIQGPEDNLGVMGKMQMDEGEQKVFITMDGPDTVVVTYMRLLVNGNERIWREVHRERIDRTRDFTPIPDIRRSLRPNPWDSSWTTEKSFTSINRRTTEDYYRRQTPRNTVKGNGNNNREGSKTRNPATTTESEEEFFEDDRRKTVITKAPGTISPDSNLFAGIVNDFAFKLVETLDLESNFVISPLSIFIALSMCYLGADGSTKAQMEQVLGMDDKAVHGENFHQGIQNLLSSVMGENSGYKLFVANGMFLAKNFAANPEFQANIRKFYYSELKDLDFGNPPISLQFINRWVSENTRNTITSIINSPPPVETRLMLLNAIYFKGMWKTQFPPELTHTTKFQTLEGNDKEIQIMRMFDATFPLFKSDDHQHTFIKLPYEGDQLSMIIALPYTAGAKPLFSIRDKILCQVRAAMKDTNLGRVEIPKFHLEYRKALTRPLQDLGLTDIFDRNSVDLSKLRKENDIFVSSVLHKAVVEVNEVGTTASGITSENFTPLIYRKNINFVADHPFAFYIVHEPTGLVLFYGKVFDFDSEESVSVDRRLNGNARPRINSERRG